MGFGQAEGGSRGQGANRGLAEPDLLTGLGGLHCQPAVAFGFSGVGMRIDTGVVIGLEQGVLSPASCRSVGMLALILDWVR